MDLPPHIIIHTWPTATLTELTHLLASHSSRILPNPSIGTRLAYRLLYHDTRNSSNTTSGALVSPSNPLSSTNALRLATQDLGSVVIGDGGPGIVAPNHASDDEDGDIRNDGVVATVENGGPDGHLGAAVTVGSEAEAQKTLADARFVAGDFLSVAILPPSAVDGSVQPASAARMGRGYGIGQATVGLSGLPPSHNGPGRERGYGYGRGRAQDSRTGGGGVYVREGPNTALPMGEWRRGEKLPDMPPPNRGRGKRRW